MPRRFFGSLLVVGSGPEGRRKKAEEILGFRPEDQVNNPDFLFLESAGSLGIEEVRNLQRFLKLKPYGGERKFVFISEAQALTEEAQNALLKTLEEPAESSSLILTAPDYDLLLPTIVSRCETIQLPAASQINLSEKELAAAKEKLIQLLAASLGERFTLLEKWGIYQDKEKAVAWLDGMTLVARGLMLNSAEKEKYLSLLKRIFRTKNFLSANCNLRLTLETFLGEISPN